MARKCGGCKRANQKLQAALENTPKQANNSTKDVVTPINSPNIVKPQGSPMVSLGIPPVIRRTFKR